MQKHKERKIRGKIRQQVRWAIDDQNLWDSDIVYEGNFKFNSAKDDKDDTNLLHKKSKVIRPQHRNIEYMD